MATDNSSLEGVDTFNVTMNETSSWKEHVFSSLGKEISSRLVALRESHTKVLCSQYLCYIYIILWYCFYLTVVRSSGLAVARVVNPT